MSSIPDEYCDLLTEKATFTTLTTMLPTGVPHMSLVWIDYDPGADRVLVNTERGRRKEKNVQNDPRAGILAPDPESWWRWLSVAGEVEEVTTEGARDHIDELTRRYLGEKTYPNPIQTERVILKIEPEHVITFSSDG